jgi:hypothetical protein
MIRWILAGTAVAALGVASASADDWRDARRADRRVEREWRDYQRALRKGDHRDIREEWRDLQRAEHRRARVYGQPQYGWTAPAPPWYYGPPNYGLRPYRVSRGVVIWR